MSEEKSYNSEPDYPDEESRSESTRRGGSYDEESDDPDNEPTVVDLVEDPDLPSPDPRIAATRPRPRRIGLNNNGARHFLLPRTVNDELIHIDDEEPLSLFSPRSARAAHALLSEEEKARRKREEDERKSEQLARRLLQQDLELNDHFVRAPQPHPRSSPQPGTEMTDEEFARMLQEQEDQMVHNDMSGYSTHSRRLLNAPRFVSPVHDDYSFLNLNSHSPSISFGRRGLHHHHGHRHHHHSPVGHMSYEVRALLAPLHQTNVVSSRWSISSLSKLQQKTSICCPYLYITKRMSRTAHNHSAVSVLMILRRETKSRLCPVSTLFTQRVWTNGWPWTTSVRFVKKKLILSSLRSPCKKLFL